MPFPSFHYKESMTRFRFLIPLSLSQFNGRGVREFVAILLKCSCFFFVTVSCSCGLFVAATARLQSVTVSRRSEYCSGIFLATHESILHPGIG
jgi:hypothetical protein